jgi:hypothetical protein
MLAILVGGVSWMLFPSDESAERRAGSRPSGEGVKPVPRPSTPSPPQQVIVLDRPRVLDTLATEQGVLRGSESRTAFALHAPVATVVLDDRPAFRWAEVEDASAYEVTVLDLERGTVAAGGTSGTASWRPGASLPRGRTYVWQVAATTSRGRVVSPGQGAAEARFQVAAQGSVEGTTPRERGIAMARLGALDDAERELEQAGADELLQQVRAWRGQRGRPTTTNGAQ